jgi:ParB family chromosome partitioning protein
MTQRRNKTLEIGRLMEFKEHPFKPYSDKRFNALVGSVRESGIIEPIIVRPKDDGKYEILSGHNRVRAATAVGLSNVPAVIYEGLSDEEADIIVTMTNLVQRGFAELSYSERAAALSAHHSAIKSQGKRTDLIQAVESVLDNGLYAGGTYGHRDRKLGSRELLAKVYGISGGVVERYLRINHLIAALKDRLDNEEFPFLAAVAISRLKSEEQELLNEVLHDPKYKLTKSSAERLRKEWRNGDTRLLTEEKIRQCLEVSREPVPTAKKVQTLISRYFDAEDTPGKISNTIAAALEAWFAANGDPAT